MSTLSWFTLGLVVVVVILLVAITIVLTLFREPTGKREGSRKNVQEKSKVAPDDKSLTRRIKKVLEDHWIKVWATIAAMIVVWMIIYLFDHIFPPASKVYLRLGGPHYELLTIATVAFAFIATIPVGKTRIVLLYLAGVLTALGILFYLVPAVQEVAGGSSSSAPVQTASRCDNIYRDYPLTDQLRPIPGKGCKMGWNILTGGLVLIDRDGNKYGPYYKGDEVGFTPPAIQWMAGGGNAVVKARFYR